MNDQQSTAYARPCFEAEDTLDSRFLRVESSSGMVLSVRLTINIGLE